MANYWEKLKDPRWQKLRLKAMEKQDFSCEICGDSESTLNVHHKEYFKGNEPWEYDLNQLAVLCEFCHENHHASLDLYKTIGSFLDLDGPFSREHIAFMNLGFLGYSYQDSLEIANSKDWKYLQNLHNAGVKARKLMTGDKNG